MGPRTSRGRAPTPVRLPSDDGGPPRTGSRPWRRPPRLPQSALRRWRRSPLLPQAAPRNPRPHRPAPKDPKGRRGPKGQTGQRGPMNPKGRRDLTDQKDQKVPTVPTVPKDQTVPKDPKDRSGRRAGPGFLLVDRGRSATRTITDPSEQVAQVPVRPDSAWGCWPCCVPCTASPSDATTPASVPKPSAGIPVPSGTRTADCRRPRSAECVVSPVRPPSGRDSPGAVAEVCSAAVTSCSVASMSSSAANCTMLRTRYPTPRSTRTPSSATPASANDAPDRSPQPAPPARSLRTRPARRSPQVRSRPGRAYGRRSGTPARRRPPVVASFHRRDARRHAQGHGPVAIGPAHGPCRPGCIRLYQSP